MSSWNPLAWPPGRVSSPPPALCRCERRLSARQSPHKTLSPPPALCRWNKDRPARPSHHKNPLPPPPGEGRGERLLTAHCLPPTSLARSRKAAAANSQWRKPLEPTQTELPKPRRGETSPALKHSTIVDVAWSP